MSLAENLLNSIPTNSNSRIAGSGSEEPHIVVDATRTIIVPDSLKTIAVKGDKDVETVTIDCIRYWDGNDLSTFSVYLNYTLPNGEDKTYVPASINVADDTISFDWLIGRDITIYSGQLKFWIVAKKLNEDGTLDKQWGSFKNSDCSIADGGSDEIYDPSKPEDVDLVGQAISAAERAKKSEENAKKSEEEARKNAERAEQAISNLKTDADLVISGAAADALATGDRLRKIERWINDKDYTKITASLSVTPSVAEIGSSVTNAKLNWSVSKETSSITLDGSNVTGTSYTDSKTYTSDKTWTLKATEKDRGGTATTTATLSFLNGVYYGVSAKSDIKASDRTEILKFNKELRSNKKPSFTANAGAGQYIYYCLPTRMGTCSFKVGGFDGGFSLVDEGSFQNSSGYSENYYIYRSENAALGSTSVTVS